MLVTPLLITMTITATRLHRSLVDYASGFPDVYDTLSLLAFNPTQYRFRVSVQGDPKLPICRDVSLTAKRAQVALNPSDRIQVNVHTTFEQYTTTNTNDYDSYNTTNEQVHEKPNTWGRDDVERGV